jgi:hypothetical protein
MLAGSKDLLAIGAGLAAYVYVAGGLWEYARLSTSGLPAGAALPLVNNRQLVGFGVLVMVIAVVFAALAVFLATRLLPHDSKVPPLGIAIAVLLIFLGLAWLWSSLIPLHLSRAKVRLTNGTCVSGQYLARDQDGVHLVDGRTKRLVTFAAAAVQGVELGGPAVVSNGDVRPAPCPAPLSALPSR